MEKTGDSVRLSHNLIPLAVIVRVVPCLLSVITVASVFLQEFFVALVLIIYSQILLYHYLLILFFVLRSF